MAAAPRTWIEATIRRLAHVTPGMVSLHLDAPIGPYRAGQHVDIRLTAPDGYQAQRSYSIASAPTAPDLELLIERIEIGEVSPYFYEVAAEGDVLELRGPIGGHFIWEPEDPKPVLLIAGGSGVAPLLSMLRHRAASGATAPMLLLYSARTWADVVYREELLGYAAADPGVEVVLAITRGASERPDDFGRRIDTPMIREVLDRWGYLPGRVYICGSNAFVEAATQGLLAAAIPAGIIRTERYG